jgi:hypothetical protein
VDLQRTHPITRGGAGVTGTTLTNDIDAAARVLPATEPYGESH